MQEIKLLDKYVLIEQITVKKESKIILTDSAKEEDKFDFFFKIIDKSKHCNEDIEIGWIPILNNHASPHLVRVIDQAKDTRIAHLIVHENELIGIEEPEKADL